MKGIHFALAILVSLILLGCVTWVYPPHTDREKAEFDKANRNVYPDDVRRDFAKFENTTIAWAGIIKERTLTIEDGFPLVVLVIEHHYYDWIVKWEWDNPYYDYLPILLSKRGEGLFKTEAMYRSEKEARASTAEGSMLIVYGKPAKVDDSGVIHIDSTCVGTQPRFDIAADYVRSEVPFATAATSVYRPTNERERAELEKANRNVYPDDIRKDASKFRNTTLAWAGIIKESTFIKEGGDLFAVLVLDHHYYNWLLDAYGTYCISLRGEGLFKAKRPIKDSEEMARKLLVEGNMIIAYGTPAAVEEDGVIDINATLIVSARPFNANTLDYSRSEPPL